MAAIMDRNSYIRYLLLAFVFTLFVHCSYGDQRKTHNMIYYDIKNFAPCVRRFNATHQIGCTSDFNGNSGVLHVIQESSDLNWLLANGTYKPYIAVLTPQMFNLSNVQALLNSDKVNGIMIDHSNISDLIDRDIGFSPDSTCPNNNFGLYSDSAEYKDCSKVKWNAAGNGMGFMDFGIPVFALQDPEEVKTLFDCYETFNKPDAMGRARPFPQCAAEMYDFMFGAKDTPTCVWRTQRMTNLESSNYCDPLGNQNVVATLLPTNKSTPLKEKSLIVAGAQLDAAGLFYGVLPSSGAENTVSGFVTLLAAAEVLGSLNKTVKENMTNIMFAFFQGESYDYIGSSRMVYDMRRGKFPFELKDDQQQPAQINLTSIQAFLEVRQLALPEQNRFYAHIDPISYDSSPAQQTINLMRSELMSGSVGTNISILNAPVKQPLPPASFQQFLRNETNIPGVVITDHDIKYTNQYYNSRLDVPQAMGIDYSDYNDTDELPIFPVAETLAGVATTIARTLYKLAQPAATDADTLQADVNLVNDLLFCFNHKPNCSRLRGVTNKDNANALSNKPYDFYVGVHTQSLHGVTFLVGELLGYFLGDKIPMETKVGEKDCKAADDDKIFSYRFVQSPNNNDTYGLCVKSTVYRTIAVSPAFDADVPDWNSTQYSTWTESQWKSYYVRAFLKPSRSQESVTFSIGMIFIIVSLTGAYFVNKKSDDLFP